MLILGISMVVILPGQLMGRASFQEKEFERECEMVYYQILQFQNDAMMDGCQRRLRFFGNFIRCSWTKKNKKADQEIIFIKEIDFSGAFTVNSILALHPNGTVSKGGKLVMTNKKNKDQVKNIIVQVGNGRIYLED